MENIKTVSVKIFGVGSAGLNILGHIANAGSPDLKLAAINMDAASLEACPAAEKICLDTKPLRGLGSGGDPERGRAAAEENFLTLKAACEGTDVVFLFSGLGGGAGTGISPVLARAAKECGALVIAFVAMPFDCEGNRRRRQAQAGLEELKAAADGVICLPNQKIFKLIDENTSIVETFRVLNEMLVEGFVGIWRLMAKQGLIEIHFADLCALLRDKHSESAFATAESAGATRSREAVDKLFAHPLLDGGKLLAESSAVLVSLTGGTDLTMAEINRVMEHINGKCDRAQVVMGAAVDESFKERLAITLVAVRRTESLLVQAGVDETAHANSRGTGELDTQFLSREETPRPQSRFVPPPPAMSPEKVEQLMTKHARTRKGSRNNSGPRQTQLPLEIVSKGRFDKSEPTIHKGEDLDVPTYIRRGVPLN